MRRPYARCAALLLLFGLLLAGAAPCLCAAEPEAPADHCGGALPGLRAGHEACACPCMASAPDAAERSDAEVRVAPAFVALPAVGARAPRAFPALPAPLAVDTSPPPRVSPPAVLRI
jgi:hypothetical protein